MRMPRRSRSSTLLLVASCATCSASAGPSSAFVFISPTPEWRIQQHVRPNYRSSTLPTVRIAAGIHVHVSENDETFPEQELPKLATRPRQIRRLSKKRKPKGYWDDKSNLKKELSSFWADLGISTSSTLPPIPNHQLLNYYERNDLRWAIYRHGGREAVSDWLGGAPIIPGKWKEAMAVSQEMRQLVLDPTTEMGRELTPFHPPKSPQQLKGEKIQSECNGERKANGNVPSKTNGHVLITTNNTRWRHKPGRKAKGYWTEQRVMVDLLKYLYDCKDGKNRPSVWMPRPSELSEEGRSDLMGAIARFGGHRKICKQLGLVPHNDWHYFEMQFRLVLELREYLEKTDCGGERDADDPSDEYCLPQATTILNDDDDKYQSLYGLIQYFGGRKFVASKLGLKLCSAGSRRKSSSIDVLQISFGKFNLDFAIRLLGFIRDDQMSKKPPLRPATIAMPKREYLIAMGKAQLADEIEVYGGYENVARRLGLDIF